MRMKLAFENMYLGVTWLIPVCDMTHLYVWHDSFYKFISYIQWVWSWLFKIHTRQHDARYAVEITEWVYNITWEILKEWARCSINTWNDKTHEMMKHMKWWNTWNDETHEMMKHMKWWNTWNKYYENQRREKCCRNYEMSHGTHMNESWHTCECPTYERPQKNESCPTYE